MIDLPALRQLVFLTDDLDRAVGVARRELGLRPGVADPAGMAALGFVHEVLTIDRTFLEFTAPLAPDTMPGRLIAARGELGYMVVVQVADLDAVRRRASALGLAPVHEVVRENNLVTQWHPRDFGTLLEIDQVEPQDTWHLAPQVLRTGCTDVVQDIAAVEIAVRRPQRTAATWAAVLALAPGADGTSLDLAGRTVRFVGAADGRAEGLAAVLLPASDPARAPREFDLAGVRFRVGPSESGTVGVRQPDRDARRTSTPEPTRRSAPKASTPTRPDPAMIPTSPIGPFSTTQES